MKLYLKEFVNNPASFGNPYRGKLENAFIYLLPVLGEFEVVDSPDQADVLLASIFTTGFKSYCQFAQNYPRLFKVAGGWHPSMMPKQTLEVADAVIVGPGESVLLDVIKGRQRGIFKGEVIDKPAVRSDNDFQCPCPGLDMTHKMLTIRSRIGCTEACTFCCTPVVYRRQSFSLDLGVFEDDLRANASRFTDAFVTDTDVFQHKKVSSG